MFFQSKVFREEAVARRARPEPLDDRLQVTAPHEWIVLLGIALSALALVAWGLFGQVERGLTVAGVLIRAGARDVVLSPVSGAVIEVLAAAGDTLDAGQPIARIRLPEAEREVRSARRIVAAVEAARTEDPGAAAQEAALDRVQAAARNELGAIETRAEETIAAPRAGELVAHRMARGQAVRTGDAVAQVRVTAAGAWQVLAVVSAREAERLAVGMVADVIAAHPGQRGDYRSAARVREVSTRPGAPPEWLADFGVAAPAAVHLLWLVLDEAPPAPLADGTHVVVRVVVGVSSPAALLAANTGR